MASNPFTFYVKFTAENGGDIKGEVAGTGAPRKIVFLDRGYRGLLPKNGETWDVALVRDTQPGERRGALIVRPLKRVVESTPQIDIAAWIRGRWPGTSVQGSENWAYSLGKYLAKAGLSGADLLLGEDGTLYALRGDSWGVFEPYYLESSTGRGTAYRWGEGTVGMPESQPARVRELIARRAAELDALHAEREAVAEVQGARFARAQEALRLFGLEGYVPFPAFVVGEDSGADVSSLATAGYYQDKVAHWEASGNPMYLPALHAVWAADGQARPVTAEELAAWEGRGAYQAAAEAANERIDAMRGDWSFFVDRASPVYDGLHAARFSHSLQEKQAWLESGVALLAALREVQEGVPR
jgi:hypothetical protein